MEFDVRRASGLVSTPQDDLAGAEGFLDKSRDSSKATRSPPMSRSRR